MDLFESEFSSVVPVRVINVLSDQCVWLYSEVLIHLRHVHVVNEVDQPLGTWCNEKTIPSAMLGEVMQCFPMVYDMLILSCMMKLYIFGKLWNDKYWLSCTSKAFSPNVPTFCILDFRLFIIKIAMEGNLGWRNL